jgi:hypothetical protein
MYEELLEKLPTAFLDEKKVARFAADMYKRTNKGKKEYPKNYTFDPLEEAKQELVDTAVYCMILWYRMDKLQEKVRGLDSKKSKAR